MLKGTIVKALSGFYYVMCDGIVYECRARGKFRNLDIKPLVGDHVTFQIENVTKGYVLTIEERKNSFIRPPICNIDQALIVVSAKEPNFSPVLLDKFLALFENKSIKPIILVTKCDLLEDDDQIHELINSYIKDGYELYLLSSKEKIGLEAIEQIFKNKTSVITGQSGVGKSSLLNALNTELQLNTNEISHALGRGKHTTRHVELVSIFDGLVADTPGFSSLELEMDRYELATSFHDFKQLATQCKFRGCLHESEPHCKVKEAVENGTLSKLRYENYLQFLKEIKERKERY